MCTRKGGGELTDSKLFPECRPLFLSLLLHSRPLAAVLLLLHLHSLL